MKRILLILALLVSAAALAQQKNNASLPDVGNVSLPLDEYNKLVELASKPPKKPDAPPSNYSVKRADLKLRVENESVSGTVQLEGETFKKGMTKVPLTAGLTVLDARQETKGVPLVQENGTETAVLSGPAEFSIALNVGLPLSIEAGRASFSLLPLSAGSAQLTLTIPGEHTFVNLSPGLITNRKSENGRTSIEATLVPGQSTVVWWATRESAAPVVPREVRFLSNVKTLVSVGEAEFRTATLADITVVQGDPLQFEVPVPTGYEVTGVTGASLESSEVQSGVLVLKVSGASQRNHQFLISMERSITGTKESAPFLSFKNAQREIGEVLVEGAGTLELTATEGGSLKRMDVKETNPYLRSLAHFPPQAAFRYHRQPNEAPTLALEWVRYPDSSVLAAVAESAEVTTMVTNEGRSLTEVKLVLKNQAQPFLKIMLPVGVSILSADVAGEKVKPVQGPDGSRVPLLRPGFRPSGSYTVSFVFLHSGTPFAKKGGSEISLPRMDVPISLLHWEIFLPEQYKVADFHGDAIAANLVPPAFQENVGLTYSAEFGKNSGNANLESLVSGQLGGIVTDPTGAIVADTHIKLSDTSTGIELEAVTDQEGRWVISNAPSGKYRLTVSASGFKPFTRNIAYEANRPLLYSSTLSVGAQMEKVTVESNANDDLRVSRQIQREMKKQAELAQNAASSNVINLQRRVAGVLPVAIDVPRAGTSFSFVRPLVLDEETKVTFTYKTK